MSELNNKDYNIPFNFAFGDNWIIIWLRYNEHTYENISMNGLGCLGSIITSNK